MRVENLSIVTGDRNSVNQTTKDKSQKTNTDIIIKQEKQPKKSLLEIISWIVGVAAGIIAIYQFLLKDILTN